MAKKVRKAKGQKTTPSKRKKGAGLRVAAGSGARKTGRRTAGARPPKGKARRKQARKNPPRPGKTSARKAAAPRGGARKTAPKRPGSKRPGSKRRGGTGQEATLAQTPATGRSVSGPTNPMPTRRSTGTAAGAGTIRQAPGLERERKRLREVEESVQGPPSSLNMDRHGSAARSGRAALRQAKRDHTETSPAMTGGDVDADWEDAYAVGDEAPGGDNPTPDQDRVDDIGRALGIEYADNEELKAADKIAERDRHRWELDPASAEDYPDHDED
ncbi:MAG TPA: DUF6335 family protein [Vicinamibacterales bacterium]|nr:DUF6335 family protein [Vicinamibacterales bacterium]